jgi:hypothetical protein
MGSENGAYLTVRNLGCRSIGFRSATFHISKIQKSKNKNKSSCLIVESPRGSNEAKETAGMNCFSIKAMQFSRDKPLIETMATNLMTSVPCQLKLTIEGEQL